MDKQEIFNKVYAHLLKQGVRSESSPGSCQYRGLKGTSCAVGCLIPDSMYDPSFEGLAVSATCSSVGATRLREALDELHLGEHADFLRKLQAIHDLDEPYVWKDSLKKFATSHCLEVPE